MGLNYKEMENLMTIWNKLAKEDEFLVERDRQASHYVEIFLNDTDVRTEIDDITWSELDSFEIKEAVGRIIKIVLLRCMQNDTPKNPDNK